MQNRKTVFLEQSYKDCKEYLEESIKSQRYESWDYIILTASNEDQAKNYRLQIKHRLEIGVIDKKSKYIVVADLGGQRIGSGGATLNVLAVLKRDEKIDFEGKKILLIHSGGDSKRIPQYSACGKLFSAVPRVLTSDLGSTIFDELIATASIMPSRMKDGIVIMSGDAMLLFNPLQIDFKNGGAASISIKKSAEIGKNHGVFLTGENGELIEFLHKKSVQELNEKGATNSSGNVDIDTGIILLDAKILNKLVALIETDGKLDEDKMFKFINAKVRLSFYGDFLYPFAKNITRQGYFAQAPEGIMCDELIECRHQLWENLKDCTLKVMSVSPSEFLHFGTTKEMLALVTRDVENYSYLSWDKKILCDSEKTNCAFYHTCEKNSEIGDDCYLENSLLKNANVGAGSVLSFVEAENITVPSGVVISGLKLKGGKFVARIYGVCDDPKNKISDTSFIGVNIAAKLQNYKCSAAILGGDGSVWTANLYPTADTMKKAVACALGVYDAFINDDKKAFEAWEKSERISLADSFNKADVEWIIEWQQAISRKILIGNSVDCLNGKKEFDKFCQLFENKNIQDFLDEILVELGSDNFSARTRLYYFASKLSPQNVKKYEDLAFAQISKLGGFSSLGSVRKSVVRDNVEVQLSARVNWGGGWTDTSPYCVENGGTVLNCAVKIFGDYPIKAQVKRTDDRKIVLISLDNDTRVEIVWRDELLDCSNPFDPVALQKACLVAMGIVMPSDDQDLGNIFDEMGGGLILSTEVKNIPRGSGLGTSSILAGACVKAIFEALVGDNYTLEQVSERVLLMEQIMSTGGGWQDQIGGLTKGIKLITSSKGLQKLCIEKVELSQGAMSELKDRFVLVYTGQRRLARNLLREIVGGYLMSDKTSILVHKKIEELACIMRRELQRGDIDAFAKILDEHWSYIKILDTGSTNTCIDFIFEVCQDLLDAKMICGAGGGGFLQAILKKGVTKADLQNRISEVFGDSGVAVWDSELEF